MPIGACLEAVFLGYLFYISWPYSTLCLDDLKVMGIFDLIPESLSAQWQQLKKKNTCITSHLQTDSLTLG